MRNTKAMRRSALTIRTFLRWYRRNYLFAICFVLLCAIGVYAYVYYVPASYERISQIHPKYLDANVFTNNRFNRAKKNQAVVIRPFTTGLQLDNSIALVKSQVFCENITEILRLQYNYQLHKPLGKREDLYHLSPIDVYGIDSKEILSFDVHLNADFKTLTLSNFRASDTPLKSGDISIKAVLGKAVKTPFGELAVYPTHLLADYGDSDISVEYMPTALRAQEMSRKLGVYQTKEFTDVLDCRLSDVVPQRADDILNTIPIVYDQIWQQWNKDDASKVNETIDNRLRIHTESLAAIETNIAKYLTDNSLLDVDLKYRALHRQRAANEEEIFNIDNRIAVVKEILAQLDASDNKMIAAATSLLANQTIENEITEYNSLVQRKDYLETSAGKNLPEVSRIDGELYNLSKALEASLNSYLSTLTLTRRQYVAIVADATEQIKRLAEHEMYLASLYRSQGSVQEQYVYLKSKKENDPLAINNISEAIRVVSPATAVNIPSPIYPWMVLLIGLLLGGGVIPIAVIFISFMMDNHMRDKHDLVGTTFPVVGEIPQMRTMPFHTRLRMIFNYGYKSLQPPDLAIIDGKVTAMGEPFLKLRTNIDFLLSTFQGTPVCLMTSFNPGSGKSFIAANLAASYVLKGKKVLLVDLDIRRGTLSKLINSPRRGAVTYLKGEDVDIRSLVCHDKRVNLDIIPTGTIQPNPTELLESDNLDRMFVELRKMYDLIIVDCAPINLVSDTSIIARIATHTLFVVRIGLLDRRMIDVLQHIYDNREFANLNVIINGVEDDFALT